MSMPTIQLEVDMMSEDAKSKVKTRTSVGKGSRQVGVETASRPSRRRNTESISGSCEICGSNSWDSDEIRGETTCSDCGYVASENMIDPGAEWVNHSNGDDRSRVGSPTTLTLSDLSLIHI